MRSVLLALLAKESAHGYELKQALEHTFGSASPLMRGLAESGRENGDNPIAALLVEGARLHLQADLDWLERCQEELT